MSATSTSSARLEAAIRLEQTDRVPVAPQIDYFAARYAGITAHDWLFDQATQLAALEKTFDGMGGWDAIMYLPFSDKNLPLMAPMRSKLPGVDLPADSTHQLIEEPLMTVEDYDLVLTKGYRALLDEIALRIDPRLSASEIPARQKGMLDDFKRAAERWGVRGIPLLVGGSASSAYGRFSYARSSKEFILDLHRRPKLVKEAIAVATPEIIESAKAQVAYTGVRRVMIGGARESNAFISPKHFEEFCFPSLKLLVDALVEADIMPLLHFDQDWSYNLPYLKHLPRAKCILQLDSFTDMVRAKEILGDHMCLMGDVPPTLLSLGTPEEVTLYCQRLIDLLGEGGGFILSSGCCVPIDAKPENVQAMLDVVHTYNPDKR